MLGRLTFLRHKYCDRREVGLAHFSETMGELAHFAQNLNTALRPNILIWKASHENS